jgi:heme-degrading monooxygenase HmoA
MSVVKINAIHVPEGKGPELEQRFAARAHAVDARIRRLPAAPPGKGR